MWVEAGWRRAHGGVEEALVEEVAHDARGEDGGAQELEHDHNQRERQQILRVVKGRAPRVAEVALAPRALADGVDAVGGDVDQPRREEAVEQVARLVEERLGRDDRRPAMMSSPTFASILRR